MTAVEPAPSIEKPTVLFTSVVGLAALIVLLQGVFAGVFLEHDGERDASANWIDAHAWGAHIATLLSVLAAVLAVAKLRQSRPLMYGSVALAVLLLIESYLGGAIRDESKDVLTVVHVPLAMAIMGVAVWLSFTAAKIRRSAA